MATLIVRAYNADGYHKDILTQDERQVWSNDPRVKDSPLGMAIEPADFPEMVRFVVILLTK